MFEHPTFRRLIRHVVRWLVIWIALWITIALGLAAKFYEGPFERWVVQDLNGVFYAMAWSLALALLRPSASPWRIASLAVALCFCIEGLQLWHPHWLEVWRATLPGHLLLGSSFSLLDLPYYALGGVVAGTALGCLPAPTSPRPRPGDHPRPYGVPA